MNTRPFDLEAAKRGEAICQRDGGSAKFIKHIPEAHAAYRVVYLSSQGHVYAVCENGDFSTGGQGCYDLVMVVKTRTVWVNLYRDGGRITTGHVEFESEQAAKTKAYPDVLRTVSVEVPV